MAWHFCVDTFRTILLCSCSAEAYPQNGNFRRINHSVPPIDLPSCLALVTQAIWAGLLSVVCIRTHDRTGGGSEWYPGKSLQSFLSWLLVICKEGLDVSIVVKANLSLYGDVEGVGEAAS